jgi:predicted nucleotidyltransferase
MTRRVKLKSKDAAALEESVQRVRAVLGNKLLEVKLFGSKATGKDQPDSDIDVLVAAEKGGVEVEDEVLDVAFDINLRHEVYISSRVIDRATLADPVWRITPFLKAITHFLKLLQKKAFLCETRA